MRRHAKASTRVGRINRGSIRRALVIRGASSGSDGSGEPSSGRRAPVALGAALVLAITVVLGAGAALADTPPAVTISAPTEVATSTARVSGTVNPEGGPSSTYWHFEYSTEPTNPGGWSYAYSASGGFYGSEAEETDPIAVTGRLESLQPDTTYSVRLVAQNGEGMNQSETQAPYPTFTTGGVTPPTVSIDAPTAVAGTTARLSGTINPGSDDPLFTVRWHFQCTPDCPGLEGEVPADGADHVVSADATGLRQNTDYEVSLVAENYGGLSASAGPQAFHTEATAPELVRVRSEPLNTEADLEAVINPGGLAATYYFEYGPTASYGTSTPEGTIPAGGVPVKVTANLAGLSPSSAYHFRVVATNSIGTVVGGDLGFTTQSRAGSEQEGCANTAIRVEQNATQLPDCRAYEQVSPTRKEGNAVEEYGTTYGPDPGWTSPVGDNLIYNVIGPLTENDVRGAPFPQAAQRTASGWTNRPAINGPIAAAPINGQVLELFFQYPTTDRTGLEFSSLLPFTPDNTSGVVSQDPLFGGDDYFSANLARGDRVDWISRPTPAAGPPKPDPVGTGGCVRSAVRTTSASATSSPKRP